MSERGYFSLRYAIPGYTFIIVFVGINHVAILEFLKATEAPQVFGAVLAFVYLLTGSALGFLVSQIYWWRFSKNGGLLGIKEFKQLGDSLIDELKFIPPKDSKERQKVIIAALDFGMYLQEKKLLNFVWRRWDMYHLLSSTYHTLGIGLAVGIVYRIFWELFMFKNNFFVFETLESYFSWENAEGATLSLIFVGVVVLLLVIRKASQIFVADFLPLWEALARDSMSKNKERLRKAFPNNFQKE